MNLLSSFFAGLVLLNIISLPVPLTGSLPQRFLGEEKKAEFRVSRNQAERNLRMIQSLQSAHYILRSA